MMETNKISESLISLAQLDIDAVHAYEQAIEKIGVDHVREQLIQFRNDHQRHVTELSPLISRLGGQPPEFKKDFKGYLIEGMTALRSVTGTEGALKAMKTNEELTNKKYEAALGWELPQDIRQVVSRNRDDERRHLEFVSRCIEQKVWERKAA